MKDFHPVVNTGTEPEIKNCGAGGLLGIEILGNRRVEKRK